MFIEQVSKGTIERVIWNCSFCESRTKGTRNYITYCILFTPLSSLDEKWKTVKNSIAKRNIKLKKFNISYMAMFMQSRKCRTVYQKIRIVYSVVIYSVVKYFLLFKKIILIILFLIELLNFSNITLSLKYAHMYVSSTFP